MLLSNQNRPKTSQEPQSKVLSHRKWILTGERGKENDKDVEKSVSNFCLSVKLCLQFAL